MLFLDCTFAGPMSGTRPAAEVRVYQKPRVEKWELPEAATGGFGLHQSQVTIHQSLISERLHDHRNPLSAANASRRQPIPQPVPPQLIQNRNH